MVYEPHDGNLVLTTRSHDDSATRPASKVLFQHPVCVEYPIQLSLVQVPEMTTMPGTDADTKHFASGNV